MSIKDLDFIDNFFMDEEDLKQLSQKAKEMKNRILMEEPCPISTLTPTVAGRLRNSKVFSSKSKET